MKDLLVINYAFAPFGGAASRRVVKMVKYLDRAGIRSTVITAPRAINPLIDHDLAGDVPSTATVIRTRSLEPVPGAGRSMPWLLGLRRAINVPLVPNVTVLWAMAAAVPAIRAARRLKPLAVLASAPEFSSFLIGLAVKQATGTPLILDYRDEWSFHPEKMRSVAGSAAKESKRRIELAMERFIARRADLILANTDGFKEALVRELGMEGSRIEVLTNGYDPEDFPLERLARDISLITHLGSVDHESLFPSELAAAIESGARAAGRPAALRFLGNVYPELERRIRSHSSPFLRIEFTGFLPGREALALVCSSGLNLLINEDLPGKERYHNLKMFDYLAAGAPILYYGAAKSMIGEVMEKSGLGYIVPRGDDARARELVFRHLSGNLDFKPNLEYIRGFDWRALGPRLAEMARRVSEVLPSAGSSSG